MKNSYTDTDTYIHRVIFFQRLYAAITILIVDIVYTIQVLVTYPKTYANALRHLQFVL